MHRYISDFILDITQNSFEANSTLVKLTLIEDDRYLKVIIEDNGKGMSKDVLNRVLDPYYTDGVKHKERKVGLGLPFVVQSVSESGGSFEIESEPNKGTKVVCTFDLCNVDTPPIGDISSTFLTLFSDPKAKELIVKREINTSKGSEYYEYSKTDLLDILGDFSSISSLSLLRDFLINQEEDLSQFNVDRVLIFK
ncbi:MAG: ATP-binding protein [Pleomorphochaeta sp.]